MNYSVALCTYNGAKYIQEQLDSILSQSLPINEIVICDDGSTDETAEIIERIKSKANTTIHLFKNTSNLGFKNNFLKAISLCAGDIIFLSDQDDIWESNKVFYISKWFKEHPDLDIVFTDGALINEYGVLISEHLWQRFGFDRTKQRFFNHGYGLDIWAWSNRATGATLAFRKKIFNQIDWLSSSDSFHDKIIALYGIDHQSLGFIPKRLIKYRIHDKQSCGARHLSRNLYGSPLKPCPSELLDFDPMSISILGQAHVDFIQNRASMRGFKCIFHSLPSYKVQYGSWAYKFIVYDLYKSLRHLIKVILFR